MSSFAFIPRSLKRRKLERAATLSSVSAQKGSPVSSSGLLLSPALSSQTEEGKVQSLNIQKPEGRNEAGVDTGLASRQESSAAKFKQTQVPKGPDSVDLAALVRLALSDYSLWADVDLRRRMDLGAERHVEAASEVAVDENGPTVSDDRGYIPLSYLLTHSPVFCLASATFAYASQPETTYVKALRTHASDIIDVRLIVSSDATSVRAPLNQRRKQSPTGYEVRRKDFALTKDSDASRNSKADWDGLTIYMENIPVLYRHIPGVVKLTSALLPPSSPLRTRVQFISLPSHHNDQPGSMPTCKGFALVTLSSEGDVQAFLDAWPWEISTGQNPSAKGERAMEVEASEMAHIRKEAQRFGLRALSKVRWEGLKAEYLLYRQQLVEEINQHQDEESSLRKTSTSSMNPKAIVYSRNGISASLTEDLGPLAPPPTRAFAEQVNASSRYPPGCLVFVRNLHVDTNKTTLRALFSNAWRKDEAGDTASGSDGVDYVDYTKNMDICYIRLSTPSHAEHFVSHFLTRCLVQTSGLDGAGSQLAAASSENASSKAIVPELVLGKREGVYWEKVPEKVRKQAVEKALRLMASEGSSYPVANADTRDITAKKKRKRNT